MYYVCVLNIFVYWCGECVYYVCAQYIRVLVWRMRVLCVCAQLYSCIGVEGWDIVIRPNCTNNLITQH